MSVSIAGLAQAIARLATPVAMAALFFGEAAHAQGTTANTSLSTTIGGVFAVTPTSPTITQNSQSGNLCSPGACYTGSISAQGNRGWQLQVKLASTPQNFSVYYVQTTVPASAQAVNSGTQTLLSTTTWLTIASSNSPSSGSLIGMMFNARRSQGGNGAVPTGAQVAAVLTYQVVAFP